ncbi:hypothetical protein BZA77DRAFT_318827 [Pyronema omphalodes]|nr:hypothetical protein BZA77DRAFT_318827 [Pyronema omphalodes]
MDETAVLNYIKDLPLYENEKPYHIFAAIPRDAKRTNIEYERGPEQPITDIRGRESEFTLDKQGFTFKLWTPPQLDWKNEQEINEKYFPAVKKLLCELLSSTQDVKRCELFSWRMRSAVSKVSTFSPTDVENMVKVIPVRYAHIDNSPAGIIDWMRQTYGVDEATRLSREYRLQLFNIWYPLVEVVVDKPLAVCDAQTVSPSDLVEIYSISEDYPRRSFMVKYNPKFRFYYLNRMTREEVCVFRIYDSSKPDSLGVPHAAFNHKIPGVGPPRESIETRILVFSERR